MPSPLDRRPTHELGGVLGRKALSSAHCHHFDQCPIGDPYPREQPRRRSSGNTGFTGNANIVAKGRQRLRHLGTHIGIQGSDQRLAQLARHVRHPLRSGRQRGVSHSEERVTDGGRGQREGDFLVSQRQIARFGAGSSGKNRLHLTVGDRQFAPVVIGRAGGQQGGKRQNRATKRTAPRERETGQRRKFQQNRSDRIDPKRNCRLFQW